MTIRVLIADDQNLVRTGLRTILNLQPDIDKSILLRPLSNHSRYFIQLRLGNRLRHCRCSIIDSNS